MNDWYLDKAIEESRLFAKNKKERNKMPYIKQVDRIRLDDEGLGQSAAAAGELNYEFTKLIKKYLADNGLNYAKINDVVGALEGAKLEFYRRVVAPYEDQKIVENGDVYNVAWVLNKTDLPK